MIGVGTPFTGPLKIPTADGHPLRPGWVLGSENFKRPVREEWRDMNISKIGASLLQDLRNESCSFVSVPTLSDTSIILESRQPQSLRRRPRDYHILGEAP